MPRPRKPRELARITGADRVNPSRYAVRNEQSTDEPLGSPPSWLNDGQATAWNEIARSMPWLQRPHRGITAIAAVILGRMMTGQDIGVQASNLLRLCLGQMGATPVDSARVAMPAATACTDPAEKYFR